MEKQILTAENPENLRIDRYIADNTSVSRTYAAELCEKGMVTVNGKPADKKYRPQNDEIIEITLPEPECVDLVPENIPLDIVYEDNDVIVVNKPQGMVVHEDEGEKKNTLINHIKAYLIKTGEYDPKTENSFAPALCNRIDRNTAGLVIAAKNAETLRVINEKIKNREIKKTYLCITVGVPSPKAGRIENYIWKDSAKNRVYVKNEKTPGAKSAVTLYKTLEEKDGLALLQVDLITGRTHQIRAHMAHIGCPLLGDGKYGKNEINRRLKAAHQALCAYRLTFDFNDSPLSYLSGKCVEVKDAKSIIGWK